MLSFIGCISKDNVIRTAKKHEPDTAAVQYNIKGSNYLGLDYQTGDSLVDMKYYDSAMKFFDLAIQIDSLYLNAYINKVRVLIKKGRHTEALLTLNKVERIRPDFVEVIVGIGLVHLKMGDQDLAYKRFERALSIYKKRLDFDSLKFGAQIDIAFTYALLGDKRKAINEIHELILVNPDSEILKETEKAIEGFDRDDFIANWW